MSDFRLLCESIRRCGGENTFIDVSLVGSQLKLLDVNQLHHEYRQLGLSTSVKLRAYIELAEQKGVVSLSRTANLYNGMILVCVKLNQTVNNVSSTSTNVETDYKHTSDLPGSNIIIIDSVDVLSRLLRIRSLLAAGTTVLMDCYTIGPTNSSGLSVVHLIVASPNPMSLFFDVKALGGIPDVLHRLMESTAITKVTFDADAQLQIAVEHISDECVPFASITAVLRSFCSAAVAMSVNSLSHSNDRGLWGERPLVPRLLNASHRLLEAMLQAYSKAIDLPEITLRVVFAASEERTKNGRRVIFDPEREHSMRSYELVHAQWLYAREMNAIRGVATASEKQFEDMVYVPRRLVFSSDTDTLIRLLPHEFRVKLGDDAPLFSLREVVLDMGRRPQAYFASKREFLLDDPKIVVSAATIDAVVEQLKTIGSGFRGDGRAGIDGSLHRISCMRSPLGEIFGLTMRLGRHIQGNADIITDLIFSGTKSILVVGPPGTGKTTVVREISRRLSDLHNICIVDTSNEIAGDGLIPHSSVGHARRMMVPSLDDQHSVMIECVQNHTPEIIVIDEIVWRNSQSSFYAPKNMYTHGRPKEVTAARTVRNRGVRIIGSAHGNLVGLVRNAELNGLVGGVESQTVGDAAAKENNGRKTKSERKGAPVFDVVIELVKGRLDQWRVVLDVADAVDCILKKEPYTAQLRTRNADGAISVEQTLVSPDLIEEIYI